MCVLTLGWSGPRETSSTSHLCGLVQSATITSDAVGWTFASAPGCTNARFLSRITKRPFNAKTLEGSGWEREKEATRLGCGDDVGAQSE